nr:MAG TPA: hypothetical protein [Caudoviricetes sp.]
MVRHHLRNNSPFSYVVFIYCDLTLVKLFINTFLKPIV